MVTVGKSKCSNSRTHCVIKQSCNGILERNRLLEGSSKSWGTQSHLPRPSRRLRFCRFKTWASDASEEGLCLPVATSTLVRRVSPHTHASPSLGGLPCGRASRPCRTDSTGTGCCLLPWEARAQRQRGPGASGPRVLVSLLPRADQTHFSWRTRPIFYLPLSC